MMYSDNENAQDSSSSVPPDERPKETPSQLTLILKEERRLIFGLGIALVVQSGVSMIQPWPLKIIFDHVILDKPIPQTYQEYAGDYWQILSQNLLWVMVAALILVALMNGVGLYVQNITLTKLSQRVVQKLRVRLFAHVLELPITHFHRMEPGEIIERITTDTDDTQKLVEGVSVLAFRSFPTFVGITAIMFWVDWQLALITLGLAPILVWATYFFGVRIKRVTRERRRHESDVASMTEVAAKTHKWIKLLGLEEDEVERMEEKSRQSRKAAVEAGSWQGFYTSMTNIVLATGSAVLILFGVQSIQAGRISPGGLLVFMNYLRSLYKPIREFTKYFIKITKAMACSERIEAIMAIEPCDLGVCDTSGAEPLSSFEERIVFDHVSFAYDEDNEIIHDISFTIEKGQKIGLVGDSGSGKSTLLNLIPRFFDVTGGSLRIDERDLRSVTLESIKKQVVMVPQDAILFHASVLENIAVGRPEDAPTEVEIRRAAEKANAHDFILDLPDGYETVLEAGGAQLSGGQAKRILIARAFLRDAGIVLLDEPTSGLDPASESLVMEAFDRLSEQKTLIVSSHRLPVVYNADLIIVLRDGRIVERGTHDELMEKEGVYAEFWEEQMGI
jgi:ABC-type multidrug transport system fused ATPase/permease subunit